MKLLGAFLVLLIASSQGSIIDDILSNVNILWPKAKENNLVERKKLPAVSFEIPVENEEFLREGLALLDTPRQALDLCTHRVISTLKGNCNQLSLEEVGKLAVMMLNCQLEIEGRSTFPCKPEMTLKQCTIGMDSAMYKVYNYMTHRAVGICSAIKSEQFRAKTEITVNRLGETVQAHEVAMQKSLENQRLLNEMGIQNMQEFKENDEKIKETQAESLNNLKLAGNLIEENLLNLQQELELRQRSEEKLSEIEKSASEISNKLEQHTSELEVGHERLLKNVDEIATNLQKSNLELLEQYNQTLEFLNSCQSVIQVASKIVGKFKGFFEKFADVAHEAGLELSDELIAVLLINLAYFTSGMVFMLFISANWISRSLLILLFVFNTVAAYFRADVELLPLNLLIWITYLAAKLIDVVKRKVQETEFAMPRYLNFHDDLDEENDERSMRERSMSRLRKVFKPVTRALTPVAEAFEKHEYSRDSAKRNLPSVKKSNMSQESNDHEVSQLFYTPSASLSHVSSNKTSSDSRPMTPAMRRVLDQSDSSSNRSATPYMLGMTGRIQCTATTAKQTQCKNAAFPGMQTCRIHNR